jgi:hypothetical protein
MYDRFSHVAHCLSHDALSVWENCDGRLTEDEVAHKAGLSPEAVKRAIAELQERGLLDDGPVAPDGYVRRQAAIRLARIGGAALLAGPLVYSVDVGSAAAAASHLAAGCTLTTCGSCTSTGSCSSLCGTGTQGVTSTNAMCASGSCYCSKVNSGGTPQTVFRCAIGSSCRGDQAGGCGAACTCTSAGQCCGNSCVGGACRSASPTC